MTRTTDLTVRENPDPSKVKTILVVYRKCHAHKIEANGDTWMFLSLDRVHYGTMGYSLNLIMLMDGITQHEFINDAGYIAIYPTMTSGCIILEAG